ncbi:MAG TPA: 7TM diverse intracellular signaling domain-containing protein [Desulfomonilia bacterium]
MHFRKRIALDIIAMLGAAFLLCCLVSGCAGETSSRQPAAINGVLDLSRWDFNRNGNVKLVGQWEFYWKELLTPEDFDRASKPEMTTLAELPAYWNDIKVNGKTLPAKGYATYRLKILTNGNVDKLSLYIGLINVAYKLFVNGRLVAAEGKVGTSLKDEIPLNRPGVFDCSISGKEAEIILQISNFRYVNGGPGEIIYFGPESGMERIFGKKIFYDFFILGSLLIIGLYQIIFFLQRRRDAAYLYFGLFCLGAAIVLISSYSQVYFFTLFFPEIPRDILFKALNVGLYLIPPSLLSFFCSTFPDEGFKITEKVVWIISAVAAVIAVLTPTYISSYVLQAGMLEIIVVLVLCLIINISAVIRKRDDAVLILTAFFLIFVCMIIDVMTSNNIIFSRNIALTPYAMFIFVLVLSYQLSIRLSRAFAAEEKIAKELVKRTGQLHEKNIELDRDIEERKRVENKLTQTWTYLNKVFNSLSSILVSVNGEGIVSQWNTPAEKITGISSSDAKGKPVWNILPLLSEHKEDLQRVISSGKSVLLERVKLENGIDRFFNIAITPLEPGEPGDAVILADDITELEKKEQQLRHMQRMETLGTLAGGIAHDFNNALMGIVSPLSLVQYIRRKDKPIDPAYLDKQLLIMEESSNRAIDMVRRLLAISRKQEFSYVPVDLNSSIKHVINICESSLDKRIEIMESVYSEPAIVFADKTQMEQMLLNLCINAAHAMTTMRGPEEPAGGKLSVEIEKIYADSRFCAAHPEAAIGDYWMVSVTDTGVGIPEELFSKIFDPFFTTKKVQEGTGLGLAMVYGIVKEHKGFITVYSEPGIGSRFNVFLPVYLGKKTMETEAEIDESVFKGELILVVDDDRLSLKSICEMLDLIGLRTITASDGEEAVDLFRRHYKDIAVVMLDMNMPLRSGRETYLEMKKVDNGVKVIISSGYAKDNRIEALIALGVRAFIPKPYSIGKLKEVLNEIIGNI